MSAANRTFGELRDSGQEVYENQKNILIFKKTLLELLKLESSFNIESFFCSTNYGFSHGAHHNANNKLLFFSTNVLNSYYECLIRETGSLTVKYAIAQKLLIEDTASISVNYQGNDSSYQMLSSLQNNGQNMILLRIENFLPYDKLVANLHSPVYIQSEKSKQISMEYVNFNYNVGATNNGFILYRARLNLKSGYILYIIPDDIRDYAVIICDYKKHLVTINNILAASTRPVNRTIKVKLNFDCSELDILVENKGRMSDIQDKRRFSRERKGILSENAITFKRSENDSFKYIGYFMWKIHLIDFSLDKVLNRFSFNSEWIKCDENLERIQTKSGPFFANVFFNVEKSSKNDSSNSRKGLYLLMSNWNKGLVFINGFNLGRYWNVGPLLTFFVPESLLNDGKNELVIFELHSVKDFFVYISKSHIRI